MNTHRRGGLFGAVVLEQGKDGPILPVNLRSLRCIVHSYYSTSPSCSTVASASSRRRLVARFGQAEQQYFEFEMYPDRALVYCRAIRCAVAGHVSLFFLHLWIFLRGSD